MSPPTSQKHRETVTVPSCYDTQTESTQVDQSRFTNVGLIVTLKWRTCTADWWSGSPALAHPANNTLFPQILICAFHDDKHIDKLLHEITISITASLSTFICSSSSPPSSFRPPLPVICTSWLDPTCGHLLISGGQRPITEFIFVLTTCL